MKTKLFALVTFDVDYASQQALKEAANSIRDELSLSFRSWTEDGDEFYLNSVKVKVFADASDIVGAAPDTAENPLAALRTFFSLMEDSDRICWSGGDSDDDYEARLPMTLYRHLESRFGHSEFQFSDAFQLGAEKAFGAYSLIWVNDNGQRCVSRIPAALFHRLVEDGLPVEG